MQTVLRVGPDRFFFYAGDRDEPPHVHVERENQVAKFWLDPIRPQESGGFSRPEMSRIQKLVSAHQDSLVEQRGRESFLIERREKNDVRTRFAACGVPSRRRGAPWALAPR
ncbi:MAG: DUF4160 domain-containing protein [Nitrospiraceae bacterium]